LKATYDTSKGSFPSEIRNLSKGGAFLRCMGPLLTVGARFPLDLSLDDRGGKRVPLDVKVAWIDYFEDTQGMGVVFVKGQIQLKKVIRLIGNLEKNLKKNKSLS
ncbi:MAG: PilZ domain-containing protein, partial [Deltaproteobacteria bacterium]|nr:PilZ domain-containing protein [Deltaproteobacteria bacterium]